MKRICGICGKKGHNARTCKDKDDLQKVESKTGGAIYIPHKLKTGDSILKSKLLKRFDERHNHRKWENNKWVNISLKNKMRDNKYEVTKVTNRNNKKMSEIIQYQLESKRDLIKWTEIHMPKMYTITKPVILYK